MEEFSPEITEQSIVNTQELTAEEQTNQETEINQINENLSENSENNNSINLGKFKDVESLLSAYNNLQAEFTKKCQKLSELTKSCDNNAQALPQQQWQEKVNNFLATHEEAKQYSKEISELLISNTELYNSENALEKAWTKVLMNNVNALQQKMQDKSFITDLINNDNQLKQEIIDEYVNKLKTKHSPHLMNTRNGAFTVTKSHKAQTLEDASKLVKAMFH